MAISVNTNVGALSAMSASATANKSLDVSMARLASGKRINSAADDAAGSAIAARLTAEVTGTRQAIRNASDAQSLISTAEGAHTEIVSILQRMRELAVQGSNDTNNDDDRVNIQAELDALSTELDRIGSVTSWAGKLLMNGDATTAGSTGTADSTKSFTFQIGQGTSTADQLELDISAMDTASLDLATAASSYVSTLSSSVVVTSSTSTTGTNTITTAVTTTGTASASEVFTATISGTTSSETLSLTMAGITFTAASSTTAALSATALLAAFTTAKDANSELTNYTAVNTGSGVLTFTNTADAITDLDVSDSAAALDTIDLIDAALTDVATQRANLGAVTNRLEHTISNLTNVAANLEAGRGRIEDADFAVESTNMAMAQILSQAATAMLAQANASKQGVLQLLQR